MFDQQDTKNTLKSQTTTRNMYQCTLFYFESKCHSRIELSIQVS
jgi:hypothetical protein